MRHTQRAIFFFAIVFAMMFEFSENTLAGQFKRLEPIPNGGEIQAHASPTNFGRAMEIDVYEFQSDFFVQDSFQCRSVRINTA